MNIENLNPQNNNPQNNLPKDEQNLQNPQNINSGITTNIPNGNMVPPVGTPQQVNVVNNPLPPTSEQISQPNVVNSVPNMMPQQPIETITNKIETPNFNNESVPVQPETITPNVTPNMGPMNMPNIEAPMPINNEPFNLAPEGMIQPVENINEVPRAPEPLMGATLTSTSNLTNTPEVTPNTAPAPTPNLANQNNIEAITPNNNNMFNNPTSPVPPPPAMNNQNTKKTKDKGNKKISTPLLITLIVVLLGGVGYGVYYFLNQAKPQNQVVVTPTLDLWEKGEELPIDASLYATLTGIDSASCAVDTSKIDIDVAGTYEYTITCNGLDPITNTIVVKDNKGPDVVTKDVTVLPNSDITIEDFIKSCSDASIENGCELKQKEDETAIEDLVKNVGTYTVTIVATDDFNNITEAKANLKVSETAPVKTLSCIYQNKGTTTKATTNISYEYGITKDNELFDAQKIVTFKFLNEEDFEEAKENYEQNGTIDDLSGEMKYEPRAKAMILTISMNENDLAEEFSLEPFPKTMSELIKFHESSTENASCSIY